MEKEDLTHKDIILLDDNGNFIGEPVYKRWNKAKWYQKLLGYFFYSYKRKFIDIKGFEMGYSETNDYCDNKGDLK